MHNVSFFDAFTPSLQQLFDMPGQKWKFLCFQVNPEGYARIVRINITEKDRRIFTPILYGTQGWDRAYNRRSSLERINSRLDNDFGFEKHYIRGKAKMQRCKQGLPWPPP